MAHFCCDSDGFVLNPSLVRLLRWLVHFSALRSNIDVGSMARTILAAPLSIRILAASFRLGGERHEGFV